MKIKFNGTRTDNCIKNELMRVAMYYSNQDIRMEHVSQPSIARDEALLQVQASGICGTDVMEWYRQDKVPLVLGHEVSGIIMETGEEVHHFKAGDRVVATHHVPCGECSYCLGGHETVCELLRKTHFYPGGFSEFVRLPSVNLRIGTFLIPSGVSFEEATFVEPLGCTLRGQRLAKMQKAKQFLSSEAEWLDCCLSKQQNFIKPKGLSQPTLILTGSRRPKHLEPMR